MTSPVVHVCETIWNKAMAGALACLVMVPVFDLGYEDRYFAAIFGVAAFFFIGVAFGTSIVERRFR